MATIQKKLLSASMSGQNVLVTGESPDQITTLHSTSTSSSVNADEIYLYAYNSKNDDVDLTLYWGPTGFSNELKVTIPYQAGRYMIVDGKLLMSGLSVTAFCSSGNGINIDGYVNRFIY